MYTYVHLGTILSPTRAWVKLDPGSAFTCRLMDSTTYQEFKDGKEVTFEELLLTSPLNEVSISKGNWYVVMEGQGTYEVMIPPVAIADQYLPTLHGANAIEKSTLGTPELHARSAWDSKIEAQAAAQESKPAPPPPAPSGWEQLKSGIGGVLDTISGWGDAVTRLGDSASEWLGAFGSGLADKTGMPSWARDFFGGFFGSLKGTIAGLGDTVSFLWGLLHTREEWKNLWDTLKKLASWDGLTGELKAILKDFVAWQDWADGKYAHAVGQILGNLVTTAGAAKIVNMLRKLLKGEKLPGGEKSESSSSDSKPKDEKPGDNSLEEPEIASVEPTKGKPKKGEPNSYGYDENGDLMTYANGSRPSFRVGVVRKVWEASRNKMAADIENKIIDLPKLKENQMWVRALDDAEGANIHKVKLPNGTEARYRLIEWKPGDLRKGLWDMGHIPEAKYSRLLEEYLGHKLDPKDPVRNKKLFLDEYNDPDNYVVEDWMRNQSHVDEGH